MFAMFAMVDVFTIDRVCSRVRMNDATSVDAVGDDQEERSEPLLSSGEVAARLGVATATISAWVRQGRLMPAVTTMGRRYRFRWSEVQEQLRAQQERAAEDE
jgi:excisionase family DNA binding protein